MAPVTADEGPQVPGGRYFCGYWAHEYWVDAMYVPVYFENGRWQRGGTWYSVTWVPSEHAVHPRQSPQWRGEGFRKGSHCTAWDPRRDEIVSQPA